MNPQCDAQMRGQGQFMHPYNQPVQNSNNVYDSASAPMKGYPPAPYGNAGFQKGPANVYPGYNQSNSQVQSNTVPPMSHAVNNQVSQDFNAMRISQNQNHPALTNAHPPQRLSNNMPEPPPPNPMGQPHYWQQPPRASPVPQGPFQPPPNQLPQNTNSSVYNSMPYPSPHPQGSAFNSNMPPQADRTMPPPSADRNMPPQPMDRNMPHQPMDRNMPHQPMDRNMPHQPMDRNMPHQPMDRNMPPQPMDRNMPPQPMDQNMHPQPMDRNMAPRPMDRNMAPPPPNHNMPPHMEGANGHPPNSFQPVSQQRQLRNASPYSNGPGDGMPPSSMPQQYSHLNNSNMHARYPPGSQSPVPQQGNNMIPPSSVGQYGHPPNNSLQGQQNRMAPLPQQAAPARKLDPDHMPSPIQVIEDDRNLKSCAFSTAQNGQVPPLVTTNFTVIDEGLCSPRFIRSAIYNVPTTADMLKQTSVPFALSISPFARVHEGEHPPPIVDPGEEGPVRCHRCRAYMSPFMQFIDAGRRFQCMLCKTTSEVPVHYFTHLDHLGQRVDKMERAELCLGSYEYIVNKDYCKEGKFPNCPAFVFLIDVSYNSIRNGMVKTVCDNMKDILSKLPKEDGATESKLRVGFVTYSSAIHFYNINSNLAQPQMLVVSDVFDMFMPLLDGFLVHPSEAGHVIDSLMAQIPAMFAETKETETLLGPAIQAGMEALRAAECAGKLFVFHSALPILEAPGKLKNRDDRKLLGTEKEKTILTPQTTFYNNLGQECVKAGCSVNLFLFNNAYIDIATIGQVCRLTGGQIYKYTYFQSDIDGERFIEDLRIDVEKPIAFDAVLRLRTSTGIRPTDFTGSFFMSNTTDVELASITCDKSIAIEIKYDDKLHEEEGVFIQCAVLYTSCSGQRRLRVHNLALNSCTQMAELFRSCELDTILNVFLKSAVQKVTEESPKQIKDFFINRSAQMLGCYRKNCAQTSSAGQLILPECMKLLPLYINCLIKCDAVAGGQEMSTDDRSFIMLSVLGMDVDSSAAYLYPRLLPLHELKPHPDQVILPTALRCSIERLKDNGVYLLENGINMFLWIGLNANAEWINEVFGVPNVARIDVEKKQILELDTPLSQYLKKIINQLQSERQRYMKLHIVRQGDKLELLFRMQLVEDRTTDGSVSYVDFLCHLHKEIRTLLS